MTREAASGWLRVFVDGRLDGEAAGPSGDVSYRDGRVSPFPADPSLVIGAEKHDAGSAYPSYSGWLDEVRVSSAVRYAGPFTRPTAPFAPDAAALALYHLDEGAGDVVGDSSGAPGGPSPGVRRYGGAPAGPEWSLETPFAALTALALATDRDRVAPGDVLRLSATVANPAAAAVADVYLGALLPLDPGLGCPGEAAALVGPDSSVALACLSGDPGPWPARLRGVALPPGLSPTTVGDLLVLVWPAGLPPGRYVFFVALVRAAAPATAAWTATCSRSPSGPSTRTEGRRPLSGLPSVPAKKTAFGISRHCLPDDVDPGASASAFLAPTARRGD